MENMHILTTSTTVRELTDLPDVPILTVRHQRIKIHPTPLQP